MPVVNDITADRRRQLVAAAEDYFRGLAQKDVSRVPWHADVVFRGPLTPATPDPLCGDAAVRTWFEGLYPALGTVEVLEHYIGQTRLRRVRMYTLRRRPPSCECSIVSSSTTPGASLSRKTTSIQDRCFNSRRAP